MNWGLEEEARRLWRRERIGTGGRKLSHVATGLGRETYWLSSSRRSSLATNVYLTVIYRSP